MKIKHCPNCKSKIKPNNKLSQGIWDCKNCDLRFYILITSENNLVINKQI